MSRIYKSYMFKDKEPSIDEFRTVVQDHFGTRTITNAHLREIEVGGGPTVGCMRGWFFGDTNRPQNVTLEAAGRSIGYKRAWVKMNGRRK